MIRTTSRTLTLLATLGLALTCAFVDVDVAHAADQKAALAKIKAHYQSAAAAYDDGELDKTQGELQQALKLAEESGLGGHKLVAQVYVLYGVLEVAGLKNKDQGVKYFAKALDISPAIQVPPTMASKAVLAAFDKAENQESEPAAAPAAQAAPDETEEALLKPAEPTKPARAAWSESPRSDPPRGDPEKEKLVDDLAAAKVSESLQQAEKDRLQKEKQEQDKELVSTKGHAQQLAKEKADTDKQLADAKARLQQLTKEKQDEDKQLADAKGRLQQLGKEKQDEDRQLAASQAGEKKEREGSNKLAHDKSESDKQLADAKRSLLELTKQKADTDRQLAAARDEAKEGRVEAKEKLQQQKAESRPKQLARVRSTACPSGDQAEGRAPDRQLAATRDEAKKERGAAKEKLAAARREADAPATAERKNKELQERTAREKLAEGPSCSAHVSEQIACTVPDEVAPGADLFVRCAAHRARRQGGRALLPPGGRRRLQRQHVMDRSKKVVHGADSRRQDRQGKVLHYYVEGKRDSRQDIVGANGHANSPNITPPSAPANPTRDCAGLAVDATPATWPARGPARPSGVCGARRDRSGAPQRQRERQRQRRRQRQRDGAERRARSVGAPVAAGQRPAPTVGCSREPDRARLGRVQGRRELDLRRRAAVAHRALRRAECGRRPDDVLPHDQQPRGARIPRHLATRGQGRARARKPQRASLPRGPDRLHSAGCRPGRGDRRSDELAYRPAHQKKPSGPRPHRSATPATTSWPRRS